MTGTHTILLVLVTTAGCYRALRTTPFDGGADLGGTGYAGVSGTSGGRGQAGTSGGGGGPNGGSGGSATGIGGSGGTGGSGPVFVGGPCVVTPDQTSVEVFGRASDGNVFRRAFDGRNW